MQRQPAIGAAAAAGLVQQQQVLVQPGLAQYAGYLPLGFTKLNQRSYQPSAVDNAIQLKQQLVQKKKMSGGLIAVIVVTSLLVAGILVVLIIVIVWVYANKGNNNSASGETQRSGDTGTRRVVVSGKKKPTPSRVLDDQEPTYFDNFDPRNGNEDAGRGAEIQLPFAVQEGSTITVRQAAPRRPNNENKRPTAQELYDDDDENGSSVDTLFREIVEKKDRRREGPLTLQHPRPSNESDAGRGPWKDPVPVGVRGNHSESKTSGHSTREFVPFQEDEDDLQTMPHHPSSGRSPGVRFSDDDSRGASVLGGAATARRLTGPQPPAVPRKVKVFLPMTDDDR